MAVEGLMAGLCALACACVLVAELRDDRRLRAVSKTTASISMVVFALCSGAASSTPGLLILFGLVASVVGDVFLLWPQTHFLRGVGAFLLAHVIYAGAFLAAGGAWEGVGFALVLIGPITWTVWRWLSPNTGEMTKAIAVYLLAISIMAALSVGACWADPGAGQQVLLLAAVLFCVSDLFVARAKFVVTQHRNVLVGLPIYYAAQLGFGVGAGLI